MAKRQFRVPFIKLVGIRILVELCLVSLVLLVGWYLAWDSINKFANGIFYAGLISVGIGFMSIKGYWDSTRSFGYQYSSSASKQDSWERTRQGVLETMENHRFLMIMLLIGAINMLAGWIIQI